MFNVPEAKVLRFFDPELEVQNKENDGGDEIEQSVPTQGATEPFRRPESRRSTAGGGVRRR